MGKIASMFVFFRRQAMDIRMILAAVLSFVSTLVLIGCGLI